MGPYNYPLNETFAALIPALLMGNTVSFKWDTAFHTADGSVPRCISQVSDQYGPRPGCGGRTQDAGVGENECTCLDRLLEGSRLSQEAASQVAPAARHPRPRCEERGDRSFGCRHRIDREGMPAEHISFNGHQRCTALKMLIVHESIVDVFRKRFTEELAKLKVGMP